MLDLSKIYFDYFYVKFWSRWGKNFNLFEGYTEKISKLHISIYIFIK